MRNTIIVLIIFLVLLSACQQVTQTKSFEQQKLAQNIQEQQDIVTGKLPQPITLVTIGILRQTPEQGIVNLVTGIALYFLYRSKIGKLIVPIFLIAALIFNVTNIVQLPFVQLHYQVGALFFDMITVGVGFYFTKQLWEHWHSKGK